jgi:glycosyltransferase involved in cell wall biosynthesis
VTPRSSVLQTVGATTAPRSGELLSVLGQTAYPSTVASARVRVANHVGFLKDSQIALSYSPALTDADYKLLGTRGAVLPKAVAVGRSTVNALRRRGSGYDLLLVHRLRLLTPLPGFDPPRRLDVYDIDDPLFVPFSGGVNRRFRFLKHETQRCVECLRRARLVLVGNSFLADRARQHAARVEVLPSCVDPSRQRLRVHGSDSPVRVGWIGSPTTSPYLRSVMPVFERLNSDQLRAKLVLVGADRSITAPWVEHHPWSLSTENDLLASFDVGIMPQPDDEWARGKCGYKILQYFSAGVPAIGSPVGVTSSLIGDDRGIVAESAEEWYRALLGLIGDPAARAEQGAAGRTFVERHYSYQRWAPELAALLRTIAS